jgi:hypothetical protein
MIRPAMVTSFTITALIDLRTCVAAYRFLCLVAVITKSPVFIMEHVSYIYFNKAKLKNITLY